MRVCRRSFKVVHLPPAEVGTGDFPALALSVRRQDERAFARSHENSYAAHASSLPALHAAGPTRLDGTRVSLARNNRSSDDYSDPFFAAAAALSSARAPARTPMIA